MQTEPTLKDIQNSIVDLKLSMEQRFGGIDGRLDGIDGRLDGIDGRLDGIDGRLDGIDGRLDGLDGRLDDLHEAMNEHSTEMDRQFREIRSTTATKDYVDERIGQLRGEFVSMIKRNSHRTSAA